MTPIEQTLISLPMAMALGLVFGLSACTITCLPYLGPVFLANDGGIRQSWRTVLPFSLGRLCSYGAMGAIAGMTGQFLGQSFGLDWMRPVLGIAALMVGLALLLPRQRRCATQQVGEQPLQRMDGGVTAQRTLMPGGLFLLGVSMALNPCAPLGTVLFTAAYTADTLHGLTLGLGFGLGAITIPSLVYGIGVAYLSERLREALKSWRVGIERLSAALLIVVGTGNLLV
jgi:cytochrome c biogenesis protein CcdA